MIKFRTHDRGDVSYKEIAEAYGEAFNIPVWRLLASSLATVLRVGGIFRFADTTYRAITDEDEQRLLVFLEQDKTNLELYTHPDFDCDDFAFRLHGALHHERNFAAMPIYITWVSWDADGVTEGHAVVSYYKDGAVKAIEPQNDNIFGVPSYWKLDMICG